MQLQTQTQTASTLFNSHGRRHAFYVIKNNQRLDARLWRQYIIIIIFYNDVNRQSKIVNIVVTGAVGTCF